MSRSDLVDLTLQIHAETKLAILVSDDGEEKNAKWVPLSQVEVEPIGASSEGAAIVTMPTWLAQEKGFI